MDTSKTELLERIKGEVRAIGDGATARLAVQAQDLVNNARQEINRLISEYEQIAAAMPLDLLEIVEKGGKVALGHIRTEDKTTELEVRPDTYRVAQFPRIYNLTPGRAYRIVLVVIPEEVR